MSESSKYQRLKSYLHTHYNFHANLGQYNLGDREQLESEAKWRMISDIMDYVDNLDSSEDNVIDFPISDDEYISYSPQSAVFAADSVPFSYFGSGTDIISFDEC